VQVLRELRTVPTSHEAHLLPRCMPCCAALRCLLQGLVRQAARLLPEFSPQNLSNTAWALATLKDSEAVQQQWRVGEIETGQGESYCCWLCCCPPTPPPFS